MQIEFNSRENVIGAGTIATHLTESRRAIARERALSVLAITGTVDWEMGKVRNDWPTGDDCFGSINAKNPGKNYARPLWNAAVMASCNVFGLPYGTIYIPCYICGELFDCWTMDREHVFGRTDENGGTRRAGILLADSGCNTVKGESRRISWQTREWLENGPASLVELPKMTNEVDTNWYARTRRVNGKGQSSTPWQA